jgi:hypothetical protein
MQAFNNLESIFSSRKDVRATEKDKVNLNITNLFLFLLFIFTTIFQD